MILPLVVSRVVEGRDTRGLLWIESGLVDLESLWSRDDLGSKRVIDYKKILEKFDLYINMLDKLGWVLGWLIRFGSCGWFDELGWFRGFH